MIKSLTTFLNDAFATLDTHNRLSITIDNQADAWLGDPDNAIFCTLEQAIMEVWGPIGMGTRRSSVPSVRNKDEKKATTPTLSPSVKPAPMTTTTLTMGSDYTSQASMTDPPLSDPRYNPPSSSTQPSIPTRRSSKNTKINPLASIIAPFASNVNTVSPIKPAPRGRKPLYIREGGSIPSIRFLEKEFNAPAAHLPCGQASDAAHLDNERLRVANLTKSREIFRKVFGRLGSR